MTKEQKAINLKATGTIVDVKRDIPDVARQFMLDTYHTDDVGKVTQGQFNRILYEIQDTVIIPNLDLWRKDNKGMLSDEFLVDLYNIYARLCNEYDKHMCVYGFSCMTGIEDEEIYSWSGGKTVTQERLEIVKKLTKQSEQSLQDLLITGKRNPVGIVAVLNNKHGWSSQNIRHETTVKTSDNLQIASALGLAIEQKAKE